MHTTYIDGLFLNVENVSTLQDTYKIKGWIAGNQDFHSLLINNISLNTVWSDRPDVVQFYKGQVSNAKGFEIEIHKHLRSENLQVKFEKDAPILNVCSLYQYITSKSGFAKKEKDLIVVDNFYADPDMVRDFAMNNLEFAPSGYHKGERSQSRYILDGTKERLEEIMGETITNWNHPGYANGVFQFCTADQPIVYHVDQQMYAAMVYLTPDAPPQTGTATYRSKFTGVSSFPNDGSRNTQIYVDTFKGNSREMNFYDGTQFEKIDEVGNVYNRLVIFNSCQMHAATEYFGDAIENSRFFHMFFFDIEK